MTQNELFWRLVATAFLTISAVVQFKRQAYAMAALLIVIPVAGWFALWWGQ